MTSNNVDTAGDERSTEERKRDLSATVVACEGCGATYESTPSNQISPTTFNYCPNCGDPIDAEEEVMGFDEHMERTLIPYNE